MINIKYFTLVFLSLLMIPPSYGKRTTDITYNVQIESCQKKYGDDSDECFSDLKDKSDSAVTDAYNKKINEINSFNISKWKNGTEDQKNDMVKFFTDNQKRWLSYRNQYCQIVSTGAQDTHEYGEILLACFLNMNNARIKEINMIHPSLSENSHYEP